MTCVNFLKVQAYCFHFHWDNFFQRLVTPFLKNKDRLFSFLPLLWVISNRVSSSYGLTSSSLPVSTPNVIHNSCRAGYACLHDLYRNLHIYKALLKSKARQSTSLFTNVAINQRGVSKIGVR